MEQEIREILSLTNDDKWSIELKDTWINGMQLYAFKELMNGSLVLPFQPVDATHALNLSAGVSNPRVLRDARFVGEPRH